MATALAQWRWRAIAMIAAMVLFLPPILARADDGGPYSLPDGIYRAVMPPDWDGKRPLPMVLFLHGYGQSSAEITGNRPLVDAVTSLGVALVVPDGINHAWGHVGAPSRPRDDLRFLHAVVADAERRWPIDQAKVYAAGFSIGASMVWDLACRAANDFAAFLPVSGAFWMPYPERCNGPVNLRHVHGLADTTVPMAGRTIRGAFTQGDVMKGWDILRAADGCAVEPDRTMQQDVGVWEGPLACKVWSSCSTGRQLELCLHRDGHDLEPGFLHAGLEWALALPR